MHVLAVPQVDRLKRLGVAEAVLFARLSEVLNVLHQLEGKVARVDLLYLIRHQLVDESC